jgi:hypothetical protein
LATKTRPLTAFDKTIVCEALDNLNLLLSIAQQIATKEITQELMASIEVFLGEKFHPANYDIDPVENMCQFHLDLRRSLKRLNDMNHPAILVLNIKPQIQVLLRCLRAFELRPQD